MFTTQTGLILGSRSRLLVFFRQVTPFAMMLSLFSFPRVSRAQDPSPLPQSVADAARNSRELKNNAKLPHKIITNDDLAPSLPAPPPAFKLRFLETVSYAQEQHSALDAAPQTCDNNSVATSLKAEIQAAEADLDQLRSGLYSATRPVASDGDLSSEYFKPGGSGLDMGSPALLDNQPPVPARVSSVSVEQRIADLQKLLRMACESPDAAKLQAQLDPVQHQLDLAQRALALDQSDFYSRPDFTANAAGQARINDEQLQVQDLQSQVDQLKAQLGAQLARDSSPPSP